MKTAIFAGALVAMTLGGCAQIQKEQAVALAKQQKDQALHDEATCLGYGYTLGSQDYGHCRERLHALNVQSGEAQKALAIAHQQQLQNALNSAAAEAAILNYESQPRPYP